MRRDIEQWASRDHRLLLVGKSLGAYNMITRVVNKLPAYTLGLYKEVLLYTIDPCWPLLTDWAPNLNRQALVLKNQDVVVAKNVYLAAPENEQAGCLVVGARNCALSGTTHQNIVSHPAVREGLYDFVSM